MSLPTPVIVKCACGCGRAWKECSGLAAGAPLPCACGCGRPWQDCDAPGVPKPSLCACGCGRAWTECQTGRYVMRTPDAEYELYRERGVEPLPPSRAYAEAIGYGLYNNTRRKQE